jgi:hypothetical protein
VQKRDISRSGTGRSSLSSKRVQDFLPGLLADHVDGTTVEPALSKPDNGRGPSRRSQLHRKRAGGLHHGQESTDSNKGRIHWPRPPLPSRFSLATLRWTIQTDNAPQQSDYAPSASPLRSRVLGPAGTESPPLYVVGCQIGRKYHASYRYKNPPTWLFCVTRQ